MTLRDHLVGQAIENAKFKWLWSLGNFYLFNQPTTMILHHFFTFFLRHRTNTTSSFLMSFAVNVLEYKDHPRNERGSYVKTNNADKLDFEIAIFLRLRYICICCSCHRAIHSFIYTWFVYVLIFTHISHHLDGCTFVLPIPCLTTVSFCYINLSSRQRSRLYRPSKELPLKQRFYIEANQNYMQCNNVEYMK